MVDYLHQKLTQDVSLEVSFNDKILSVFRNILKGEGVRKFIAYACLINAIGVFCIVSYESLILTKVVSESTGYIYMIIRASFLINIIGILPLGLIVFERRFCNWSKWSFITLFTYSSIWIIEGMLFNILGIKFGFTGLIITNIILIYITLNIIINLLNENFKCFKQK